MKKLAIGLLTTLSFSAFADYCSVTDMKSYQVVATQTLDLAKESFAVAMDEKTKKIIIATEDNYYDVYKTGNLLIGANAQNETGEVTLSILKVKKGLTPGQTGSTSFENLAIAMGSDKATLVYYPANLSISCVRF